MTTGYIVMAAQWQFAAIGLVGTGALLTIDNGQTVTLQANPSGGTTAYSYQWYSNSGCTTTIGIK